MTQPVPAVPGSWYSRCRAEMIRSVSGDLLCPGESCSQDIGWVWGAVTMVHQAPHMCPSYSSPSWHSAGWSSSRYSKRSLPHPLIKSHPTLFVIFTGRRCRESWLREWRRWDPGTIQNSTITKLHFKEIKWMVSKTTMDGTVVMKRTIQVEKIPGVPFLCQALRKPLLQTNFQKKISPGNFSCCKNRFFHFTSNQRHYNHNNPWKWLQNA